MTGRRIKAIGGSFIIDNGITFPAIPITASTIMTSDGATITLLPGGDTIITTLPPAVDVIISGITYMLPYDISVELPQTDGSTWTIGPQEV
jgi:hypothetical protein